MVEAIVGSWAWRLQELNSKTWRNEEEEESSALRKEGLSPTRVLRR